MNKLKIMTVGVVSLVSALCAFAQLPPGYEQIPCIVADGNQYLDTGFVPTSTNMGFYLDFYFDGEVSKDDSIRVMGSSKVNSGQWGGVSVTAYKQYEGGQISFGSVNSDAAADAGLVGHTRMQLELKSTRYQTSTGAAWRFYPREPSFWGSVYLGIVHTDGSKGGAEIARNRWLKGRIYRLKFYDGEDIVHDFVPVRIADGRVGLYDVQGNLGLRVSATETPYSAGPSDMTFLEYVEATGAQYLDTGYTPTNDAFGFYLDFRYDNAVGSSGQAQVLGSSLHNGGRWGGVTLNGYTATAGGGGQLTFGANGTQDPMLATGQRMWCRLSNRMYTSSTGASVIFSQSEMQYYGSVYLGKIHYERTPDHTMSGRYYAFKLFDGEAVVRDYRPAKQDGVAGFYDLVTRKFYGSATSTAYVAGPEVTGAGVSLCSLEVASVRKGVGSVSTGFGTFDRDCGSVFRCQASPYWTNETMQVKYVCLGWTLKDGRGTVLLSEESLKFRQALPTNEVLVLEWNYVPCELPDGYRLLKNITSTGTQAADLGLTPRTQTRVIYDFRLTEASSTARSLSGWGAGGSRDGFMWGHMETAAKGVAGVFSSSVGTNWTFASTGVPLDTSRHVFDLNDGVQAFDGRVYGAGSAVATPHNNATRKHQNLYAAALHGGWGNDSSAESVGVVNGQMKSDVYGCRLFAGSVGVSDFVPCRRTSDSVAGLYDVLTGEFKPSFVADTAFVAGPEADIRPPRRGAVLFVR